MSKPNTYEYNGQSHTAAEWAEIMGYAATTMTRMLKNYDYDMNQVVAYVKGLERTGRRRHMEDCERITGNQTMEILAAWRRGERTPQEVSDETGIPLKFVYKVLPRTERG